MTPVAIALGSNMGDSLGLMREAVQMLRAFVDVERVSHPYRTAPMYVEDQPPFLNGALIGNTDLGPRSLLLKLKEIENEIGRQTRARYGPREIDLDLIAYGSLRYSFAGSEKPLTLPHPKTAERRFVIEPLFEIAPELRLPGLGKIADLIRETKDQAEDVVRLSDAQL